MANDIFEQKASWEAYRALVDQGRPGEALETCLKALEVYKAGNADFATQHKGTPYYVLGYCALASHDFSGATLFFDAALSEDLKNHSALDTPAKLFMRLEDRRQDLLASEMVNVLLADTQELLQNYNGESGAIKLTMSDLRTRFFQAVIAFPGHNARALVTTFISFVAEWKYRRRLLGLAEAGSREVFYLHLFRGCVLFESLLKENPKRTPGSRELGGVLRDLKGLLNINGTVSTSAASFGDALIELAKVASMEDAMMATAKLRNTVGHKISWPSTTLTPQLYDQAVNVVASACLHAISCLY